jgi:hypothetical protein
MSGTYSSMNINRDQPHSVANAYNALVDERYCLFYGFLRRFSTLNNMANGFRQHQPNCYLADA